MESSTISSELERHIEEDDRRFGSIKEKLDVIGSLSVNVATVSTDVAWLKKFFWAAAVPSIGSLALNIFQIVRK